MTATIEKMPEKQKSERERLRAIILELTETMQGAIGDEKFSDYKGALDTVLSVYRTLNNVGDLDESGSALDGYAKDIRNGRNYKNSR